MKRWGTIALMLFAFIVGFASTYNCGGGSSATAAGDADTLEGHPASYFAIASHTHPEYMDAVGTCSNGQVLKWNGSAWVCGDDLDSTDSDTLDGLDSSDFALSSHSHSSSSSTQYYSVSSRSNGYIYNMLPAEVDDEDRFANADTTVWWDGLSPSGIDSTSNGVVFMPVHLPTGAMITSFGIVYYDEIGDSHPVSARLRRSPEKMNIARITSTGIAFTPQYAWTTSIDPIAATADNSTYSYYIRASMRGGLDMAIISAMVGYRLP